MFYVFRFEITEHNETYHNLSLDSAKILIGLQGRVNTTNTLLIG